MKSFVSMAFVVLTISLLAASAPAQQASNPAFDFERHGVEPGEPLTNDSRPWLQEDRVLKTGPLAPTANDRALLREFLKDRHTGLIRLMPREVYDRDTYRTTKYRMVMQLNVRGGGAYYSFAKLTHVYGYGNDLALERNILSVGFAGADYGMLANVGERRLEDITVNDPAARFMAQYAAPRPEPTARSEYRRFQTGVVIDGVLYRSRLPLEIGTTYLLRSIAYRESDVLVAFRPVRKDTDGSIIIAWKLLKTYSVPELSRK